MGGYVIPCFGYKGMFGRSHSFFYVWRQISYSYISVFYPPAVLFINTFTNLQLLGCFTIEKFTIGVTENK